MDTQAQPQKKRIRHLLAVGPLPPPPSGSNVSFQVFCEHLTDCTSVEILSIIDSSPKQIKENTSILTWRNLKQALRQVGLLWQMGSQADAILLFGSNQYLLSLTPLLVLLSRLLGKPCYVRSFGGSLDQFAENLHPLARAVMYWGFRNAHGLLVETQLLYRYFAAISGIRTHHLTAYRPISSLEGLLAPAKRAFTQSMQSESGQSKPGQSTPRQKREKPALRLLFISWIREEKGVTALLQALQYLYREEEDGSEGASETQIRETRFRSEVNDKERSQHAAPKIQCDLFGPIVHEYEEKFKSELAQTPWASYCGILQNEDVLATMGAYDVLVFPTFYQGEGYPGIIVEAMIAGLPVVTTRFRSIPDMIEDQVNGLIVEPNDSVSLAEGIRYFLENPGRIPLMAEANHRRHHKYDLHTVLPEMIGIMESSSGG
ncbi:MAG: glycosyltransferase [Chloroflexota bacterium]